MTRVDSRLTHTSEASDVGVMPSRYCEQPHTVAAGGGGGEGQGGFGGGGAGGGGDGGAGGEGGARLASKPLLASSVMYCCWHAAAPGVHST